MNKGEFLYYFDKCFQDKTDSRYTQYLEILRHSTVRTISKTLTRRQRNETEKLLIQTLGYEKWKIIPLKFFLLNNLPTELSNDYERNIRFLTPLDYFMASYTLMLYFENSNPVLCLFFKNRLRNILKRKQSKRNIPKDVKDLIYYKILKNIELTQEDRKYVSDIFIGHYSGRHNKRNRHKGNKKDKTESENTNINNDP